MKGGVEEHLQIREPLQITNEQQVTMINKFNQFLTSQAERNGRRREGKKYPAASFVLHSLKI